MNLKMNNLMMSKVKYFKDKYLIENGHSKLIERYKLPLELLWTSGDSIFRSDSILGKEYKFFRFSQTLDLKKKSACWNMSDEDIVMIHNIHNHLKFPMKGDEDYHRGGLIVYNIQFFGKCNKLLSHTIKISIKKEIHRLPCCNCGSNQNIECDHKNDLYNDPRTLSLETQTINDFQPLCKHCNDVKRSMKARMLKENKRIGASYLGYTIDFTQGTELLDLNDPLWYVGTYWGDCLDFKKQLLIS